MTLTPKQMQILEYIARYKDERGYGPSQPEIAAHFGFKSLGTVQSYLKRLQGQGLLTRTPHGRRDFRIKPSALQKGLVPLRGGVASSRSQLPGLQAGLQTQVHHNHSGLQSGQRPPSLQIPLLGRVAAGRPIEAVGANDTLDLAGLVFPAGLPEINEKYFALKVAGDSMIEDGIFDGDVVIIKSQPKADNGQVVVATLQNEATIKRYYRFLDRIELHPANANYAPIVVRHDDERAATFRVEGILTTVLRSYR